MSESGELPPASPTSPASADVEPSGETAAPGFPERVVDVAGMKALAHPLRVAIVDELSTQGPATASGLAERLGESSGATSYHLRQLARHGFVHELEGRGSGRERWWDRVPGGLNIDTADHEPGSAAYAAGMLIAREWERARNRQLDAYLADGARILDRDWLVGSRINTVNLRLTVEEMTELTQRLDAVMQPVIDEYRGRDEAGSRPVQLHFNAFPLVAGIPTPEEESA